MKKAEIIFGLFLLTFSVFMFVEGLRFPYSSEFGPGPGFAPVWLSGILILLILSLIVINIRKDNNENFFASKKGALNAIKYIIVLILAVFLSEYIGLIIAMTIFSFIVFKFIEKYSLKSSLIVSIGTMVFIYLVFDLLLDINLPGGTLFT